VTRFDKQRKYKFIVNILDTLNIEIITIDRILIASEHGIRCMYMYF